MAKKTERKPPKGRPRQLSVFITEEAWRRLAALQDHYQEVQAKAGRSSKVTQPETIELALRDTAVSVGIEQGTKRGTK